MRTNYKKLKKKSEPSSIRFDLLHLEFIKQREPLLRSSQEIVDFLLQAYWERYKVQPKSPFVEEKVAEEEIKVEAEYKPMFAPTKPKSDKVLSLNYFVSKMQSLDKDDTAAILQLKEEAESSSLITSAERKNIVLSLQNGTY